MCDSSNSIKLFMFTTFWYEMLRMRYKKFQYFPLTFYHVQFSSAIDLECKLKLLHKFELIEIEIDLLVIWDFKILTTNIECSFPPDHYHLSIRIVALYFWKYRSMMLPKFAFWWIFRIVEERVSWYGRGMSEVGWDDDAFEIGDGMFSFRSMSSLSSA